MSREFRFKNLGIIRPMLTIILVIQIIAMTVGQCPELRATLDFFEAPLPLL